MKPERMVLQLTDGTEFAAEVHVESGVLHLNMGWGITIVVDPGSARQVCKRILELVEAHEES